VFYHTEVKWTNSSSKEAWNNDLRGIIFFNHTSLYEILYISAIPSNYLYKFCRKMVAPGADKTLNRPIVGKFFNLMLPQMIKISRKRDHTWDAFKEKIRNHSIVTIAAEGRMKRANGLDSNGKKMNVKSGNIDIINMLENGNMIFAYSGGLHHVQEPGQRIPRLFRKIKMNVEVIDIKNYKLKYNSPESMLADLQRRLENNCPELS
jgi:hypothetical protein